MGLKGDISELTSIWRGTRWRVKVWLLLSGFIASASLASLSEAVAKWKGFILAGIEFYREYIRLPFSSLIIEYLSIRYTHDFFDFISIGLIMSVAMIRSIAHDVGGNRTRWDWITDAACIAVIVASVVNQLIIHANRDTHPSLVSVLIAYGLIIALSFPIRSAGRLLRLVYLVTPPTLVGLLAAINVGLK